MVLIIASSVVAQLLNSLMIQVVVMMKVKVEEVQLEYVELD